MPGILDDNNEVYRIIKERSLSSRNRMYHKFKWLIPVAMFILSSGIFANVVINTRCANIESVRARAELNAVSYSDRMERELGEGISITESLEQVIISDSGVVTKFNTIAEDMFNKDYIQSIQMAPDGVVTDIYPDKGNDAGKIDLINDSKRGDVTRYGIDNDMIIMQGPFELNQGGMGIAIRNPVFIEDEEGNSRFWGLVIVIVKVPEIFIDSVEGLDNFGYDYCLTKTKSPLDDEYDVLSSTGVTLVDPVAHTFTLGGCELRLEVMPKDGWKAGIVNPFIIILGSLIVVLVTGLTIAIIIIMERQIALKNLSYMDTLTGIYNRSGFNEQLAHYMKDNKDKPCVGILLDIDNFKFINDLYGHAVGDEALRKLAASMKNTFSDDKCERSVIGRNGGDEFCMILKNCHCSDVEEKIKQFAAMKRMFVYEGQEYNYTISVGYVEYPKDVNEPSKILHYADMALYEVKIDGKQGCKRYNKGQISAKRSQLGFSLGDISENLPGAFLIYKADKNNDEILFANHEMVQFAGCKDIEEFFEHTQQHFSNLIHPDDRKRVEESIWSQIDGKKYGINDYVKFNMLRRDKTVRQVLDYGRIVHNNRYGRVFYVLIMDQILIDEYYK